MKKIRGSVTLGYILLFIIFSFDIATAKNGVKELKENVPPRFELNNGDRVVFLGNSLFENDLQFGYLEFLLTTRFADRDLTFRNLGWSGDTVFGEARSYYTTPPTPYDLMIQQLTVAKPTVVFIAYGANEAEGGEEGIPSFTKGLLQLLDKIEELGAQSILLSPIPFLSAGSPEILSARNNNLKLYSSAIAETASERDMLFVDILTPFKDLEKKPTLSEDGVHLNETGYYYLASIIEKGLGLSTREWSVNINLSDQEVKSNIPIKLSPTEADKENIKFTIMDDLLPLPLPAQELNRGKNVRILQIRGLRKGYYTLAVDGDQVTTASAKKWAQGVDIDQGASFIQSRQLLDLILNKNELFFHQYRPLNRTYIIGFRSYEQGRHVKGLEDLNIIIEYLEGQIKGVRMPKSHVYQLTAIQ